MPVVYADDVALSNMMLTEVVIYLSNDAIPSIREDMGH